MNVPSETPLTDSAEFSATTERPASGDFELRVVDSDLARRMEKELQHLRVWKADQLAVERSWDVQAVGKALNLPLGCDIRRNILPAILKLQAPLPEDLELAKQLRQFEDCGPEWAKFFDLVAQRLEGTRRT